MSNLLLPLDSAAAPADNKQPACHLVSACPAAPEVVVAGEERDIVLPLRTIGRPDSLTAQRVEVGMVLLAMLGKSAAAEYLVKHAVDPIVMERVLSGNGRRRGTHDASGVRT